MIVDVRQVGMEVEINIDEEKRLDDFLSKYSMFEDICIKSENDIIKEYSTRVFTLKAMPTCDIRNFVSLCYSISKLSKSTHPYGYYDRKAGSIHTHISSIQIESQEDLNKLTLLIPFMPRVITFSKKGIPLLVFRTQVPWYLDHVEDECGYMEVGSHRPLQKRSALYIRNLEAFLNEENSKNAWITYRGENRIEFRSNESVPVWVYCLFVCGKKLIDELAYSFADSEFIVKDLKPSKVRSVMKFPYLRDYYEIALKLTERFYGYSSDCYVGEIVCDYLQYLINKIDNREKITMNTFAEFIDFYAKEYESELVKWIKRKYEIIMEVE